MKDTKNLNNYEEKAEGSRQERVNYEKEFCDRIYTEDATDDDITRTVERITGMKRITCNKIVGFLNKSNKLTANEKQILKMYVMLCNDTDALVSIGYLDFCNGKDLEEIATEIEEKAEKIVDNIKQEEIKSRKNSVLLGVVGATVTITAAIVGAPVVAAVGAITTITGLARLAKSVKKFGFKIR